MMQVTLNYCPGSGHGNKINENDSMPPNQSFTTTTGKNILYMLIGTWFVNGKMRRKEAEA
jgi:hypothetical protein